MKLFTWNVNGYNACYNKGELSRIFEMQPDFICLQELKVSDEYSLSNLFNLDYQCFTNIPKRKGRNGVAIYTKTEPSEVVRCIGNEKFDSDGRYIELRYKNYTIINVYIPHGDRNKSKLPYKLEVFRLLTHYLSDRQNEQIILAGDFNVARSEIDALNAQRNTNNTMFTIEERNALEDLLKLGFVDCFREQNEDSKAYTWWPYAYNARERDVGWRIDYILLSAYLSKKKYCVSIRRDILGSDHCPVCLDIENILGINKK